MLFGVVELSIIAVLLEIQNNYKGTATVAPNSSISSTVVAVPPVANNHLQCTSDPSENLCDFNVAVPYSSS